MEGFIVWSALCVVAGLIARAEGRAFYGYLLLAFFLSPLVGVFTAAVVPRRVAAECEEIGP